MFDSIIKGGRWFDGTGAASAIRHLGIKDGKVAAISATPLDETGCDRVVDATGRWVVPGMIDIHTHYDVEVLLDPSLSESVRHGVTTVLLGSCSLSTVHVDGEIAGDLFGRVEAIPRAHVVRAVEQTKSWHSAAEYAAALDALPLGPNVASFIGHSDIRSAVMGLDRATRKDVRPSETELAAMAAKLTEALDAGFVGMSSQRLLFDKLDGELCRS
ncbi:amidohydrolase family protein, partial [Gordonia aichiensis]